ncbi:MAG: hypothetical protein MUO21_06865, partial [Nitrososphaeraceae archaeon]|nr:hypothetical protein [Nitrososphaeraceae archaeon]
MSYCKCVPKKTINDTICVECWPYCNICAPYVTKTYSNFKRFICENCTDPSISINGHRDVAKRIGLLKSELGNVVCGNLLSNKSIYKKQDVYYSIQSLITVAEETFKNDHKRLKKLEKFKSQWKK